MLRIILTANRDGWKQVSRWRRLRSGEEQNNADEGRLVREARRKRDVITIGEMDDPQPLAGEVRITTPDMSVSISNYGADLAERITTV